MDYTINERNDQQEIIDKALRNMAEEFGAGFDPNKANLAEFCRLTGITRSKARKLKADGFKVKPHGNVGRKHGGGILAEHTEALDGLLRSGVTNSSVCFDAIRAQGYEGGLTTVKTYIRDHQNLVPAKRKIVSPQTSRGQRYQNNAMNRGYTSNDDLCCQALQCYICADCCCDCI